MGSFQRSAGALFRLADFSATSPIGAQRKCRPKGGWRLSVLDRTKAGMRSFAMPDLIPSARIVERAERGRTAQGVSDGLDVDLLRNRQRVVDFDPKISGRAFDLAMPQEKLNSTEISSSAIDQSRFGSAK